MSDFEVSGGSEIVVAEDPNGALLIGDDTAIAEFVARWQTEGAEIVAHSEVIGVGRAAAISNAADLGAVGAKAVHYVRQQGDQSGNAGQDQSSDEPGRHRRPSGARAGG